MLRYLAILPLAHVTVSYLYLYFLYAGFGANVAALSSVENVFSVSFAKIAPLYIVAILIFCGQFLYATDDPFQFKGKEFFSTHPSLKGKLAELPLKMMPWLAGSGAIIAYLLQDTIHSVLVYVAVMPFFTYVCAQIAVKNELDLRFAVPVTWALSLIPLLLAFAYSYGFSLRHDDIDRFKTDHVRCSEYVVLFPVGEDFLASTVEGQRSVIAPDCSELFSIPQSKPILWLR